ncbi:class-II fumarase/aspartase family protein [Cribrihabitans neustonicus]|uniref:class-II fumarase/aspartase family protein n=1 Tax=Cribrihabitans neustonicus TaxID=1429085 RepID=UPI003B5AD92B
MPGSLFDSQLYGGLFDCGEAGRLFSDAAELRAMLLVEGALAKAQGAAGVIPRESAAAIGRAVMEIAIDPGVLKAPAAQNGVPVPGLVAALRAEMNAPEHAQYVHWGATSQDIMDSALMLRLRQVLALVEADLSSAVRSLGALAELHASLPMPGRTYGQHATPTSFGAVAAGWGTPLLALIQELPALRESCLLVSLSGAAGTGNALGPKAAELRAALAKGLNLGDPGRSWHTDRTPILRIADWLVRAGLALGKLGEDCTALAQTGIAEVSLGGAGASSTMPQKQNPVAPAVLTALARQEAGLLATLQAAAMQQHQRDGAAWFTEWLCLPQIVLGTAAAARAGAALCKDLQPRPEAMAAALDGHQGLIHAEALSFALAAAMPRPEAQAEVKRLCQEAAATGASLKELAQAAHPGLDTEALFDPARQLGLAPQEAKDFAAKARVLKSAGG